MMRRILRAITSFAIVLGAYFAYALVAVPLIEPVAAGPRAGSGSGRRGAADRIEGRLAELHRLIPLEARETLKNPKILESDEFKLLLHEYTNLGDSRVRIEPCVLIYTPGGAAAGGKPKPPVVLYAPKGAVMLFDRPLDLRRGEMGQPVSGKLLGEITITSAGELEGPEDDLRIETRDVELTREQISTDSPVNFRHGKTFGSGRGLKIELLTDKDQPGANPDSPAVTGIKSFKLAKLDALHLEPTKPEDESAPGAEIVRGPDELDSDRPLEITCQGAFYFDPIQQYAKFQNRVDVSQLNPEGPADQLNCELLTIYFSRSRKNLVSLDGQPRSPTSAMADDMALQLREIEATGYPVIVRAPSRQAEARGERLTYFVEQKKVVLEGSNEVFLKQGSNAVFLKQGPNETNVLSIQYTSKGKGRLGEILAQGAGWIEGQLSDKPGERINVSWGEQLLLEPDADQHLAILSGGVKLNYGGLGEVTADRVDFWLFELPAGLERDKLEVKPDRMMVRARENPKVKPDGTLVRDRVWLNSPQAHGDVGEMQIWFKDVAQASPGNAGSSEAGERTPRSGRPGGGGLADSLKPKRADEPIERRFKIHGETLQAQVLMDGRDANLAELILEGNVQLDEIPLIQTDEMPIHVEGNRVQVIDAHTPNTEITVIGRPARFQGRGLALTGTNINVNGGTNRLWVDGSGVMTLPIDSDLKGDPLPVPANMTITWQERMNFDGQTARFDENVTAGGLHQHLRTETLEARFVEPIVFRNLRSGNRPKPEIESITCRGGVFMEGRTYKTIPVPPGMRASYPPAQESWEQFQIAQLTINRRTGAIDGQGPGQMTTIQPRSSNPFEAGAAAAAPRPVSSGNAKENKLAYLHVRFARSLTGNINRRQVTFHDQVECVHGEVPTWQSRLDINDPDSLGDRGVKLTADRLTVADAGAQSRGPRSIELEAVGNVLAENRTYTARASRLTYSEAKDWLILEGNGHVDAELYFQQFVGGPVSPAAARKIYFWPKSKRVKVVDGRSLEMGALSTQRE